MRCLHDLYTDGEANSLFFQDFNISLCHVLGNKISIKKKGEIIDSICMFNEPCHRVSF